MSKYIKENDKKGTYKAIKDPRKLAMQLHKDLQHLNKDGHLDVRYDPGFAKILETPMPDSIERKERAQELEQAQADNFDCRIAGFGKGTDAYLYGAFGRD